MRFLRFPSLAILLTLTPACGDVICPPGDLGCIAVPDLDPATTAGDTTTGQPDDSTTEPEEPPPPPDPCYLAHWDTFAACHIVLFPHYGLYPETCYLAATAELAACPDSAIEIHGEDGADSCWSFDSMWGMWTWCQGEQWVCKVDGLAPDLGPICADTCGQTWIELSEDKPTPCP